MATVEELLEKVLIIKADLQRSLGNLSAIEQDLKWRAGEKKKLQEQQEGKK